MTAPATDTADDVREGRVAWLRRWVITALIVVVLPTISVYSTESGPDALWLPSVALCGVALLVSIPSAARVLAVRPPILAVWGAWVLALGMLISLVLNPPQTQAGMYWTAAAIVAAAISCAVAELGRRHFVRHVVFPLAIVAAVEGCLMAVQTITGDPVGLRLLWADVELRVIDGILRPQGTFFHVFEPALLATVALGALAIAGDGRRRPRQILAAAAATPIGLSHSRSAVLGALVVVGALLLAHRRRTAGARSLAVAMVVGLLAAAVLAAPGWLDKLDQSTSGDLDDVSVGRITLARQAVTMIADHPLTGVGTAKYIPTLAAEYEHDPEHPFAVHNFALRVFAELGIPLGLAVVAVTVAAGIQAVRAGPIPGGTYLAMVPWMLFDILYYDRLYGLLILGVWWGVVAFAVAPGRPASA